MTLKTLCFAIFFFFVIFINQDLFCINLDSLATLNIPEVSIYQSRNKIFKDDKFITRFDSLTILRYQNANLGELLMYNTPCIVRQYGGAGSLATLSFRGTGANHTQVSWNGFPLNALSSGEMDLSLITTDVADQIQVVQGTPGAMYGSGTFGGVIELNSQPDWNNRLFVKIGSEVGAFDQNAATSPLNTAPGQLDSKHYSIKVKAGNERIQSNTTVLSQQALNEYPYIDYSAFQNPLAIQSHNQFSSGAFIESLNFKISNNVLLESGIWLQRKYYQVPGFTDNRLQRDSTAKVYLKFIGTFGKSSISIKSGYFYDLLHYTSLSLDSRIGSKRLFNDINYRNYVSKEIIFDAGLSFSNLEANNNNYVSHGIAENIVNIYSAIRFDVNPYIFNFSFRKDFTSGYNPLPQFSFGLEKKLNLNFLIKGNISNKFRLPSFNEKYWPGLGNPAIKPEKGWGIDVGPEGGFSIFGLKNKAGLVLYSTSISDWIVWAYPDYKVQNYMQVWSRGIESNYEITWPFQKGFLKYGIKYNYTPTTSTKAYPGATASVGKQLMLVPVHSFNSNFYFTFSSFFSGLDLSEKGKSFKTSDESGVPLDGYSVFNLFFGNTFKFKLNCFRIDFKICNIFDAQYRTLPEYPMPSRAYYITLNYIFNKSGY
jgi:iron complex outermembrane receptor protein